VGGGGCFGRRDCWTFLGILALIVIVPKMGDDTPSNQEFLSEDPWLTGNIIGNCPQTTCFTDSNDWVWVLWWSYPWVVKSPGGKFTVFTNSIFYSCWSNSQFVQARVKINKSIQQFVRKGYLHEKVRSLLEKAPSWPLIFSFSLSFSPLTPSATKANENISALKKKNCGICDRSNAGLSPDCPLSRLKGNLEIIEGREGCQIQQHQLFFIDLVGSDRDLADWAIRNWSLTVLRKRIKAKIICKRLTDRNGADRWCGQESVRKGKIWGKSPHTGWDVFIPSNQRDVKLFFLNKEGQSHHDQ
jgi:hypothetical protein